MREGTAVGQPVGPYDTIAPRRRSQPSRTHRSKFIKINMACKQSTAPLRPRAHPVERYRRSTNPRVVPAIDADIVASCAHPAEVID